LKPEIALGQVLRELRLAQGLSQEKLAHEAGIERNYISLLELGKGSATVSKLFQLAPLLGVSVSSLMARVEDRIAEGQGKKPS
jgi:transcriptional regulator with XRE-family HTH domain